MPLHRSTFEYMQPSPGQISRMNEARAAVKLYADAIEKIVPPGPDQTYALRQLREVAMWVNIALTRDNNGKPLED